MNVHSNFFNRIRTPRLGFQWRISSFFLIVALFLSPILLLSQNFNFIQYGLREGLSQSEVTCIAQGKFGYLWLGTKGGGLCKFDGKQFQTYTQKEGLPSNFINAICQDEQGGFWIGTSKGIARQTDQGFKNIIGFEFQVSALEFLSKDELIAGGPNGLYRLKINGEQVSKEEFYDVSVNEIKKISQGKVSVATSSGWILLGDNYFEQIRSSNGLVSDQISSTAAATSNSIWVISQSRGMTLHSIINPQRILQRIDNSIVNINSSFFQNQQLWLGSTDKGYYIYRDNEFLNISSEDRLPNNSINQIFEDNHGQKWMASAQGLIKLLERNFRIFEEKHGLPNKSILTLAEDTEGVIWIGMNNGGLAYLRNNTISKYKRDKDFLTGKITALCFDDRGRLWAGTANKGIAVLDSLGLFKIINEGNGLNANEITKINKDELGNLWVGTNSGISKIVFSNVDDLEEMKIQKFPRTDSYSITDLTFDQLNQLWFSTVSGKVGRIVSKEEVRLFDQQQGLPETPVNSLVFDNKNRLWIGTAGNGIYTARKVSNRPSFSKHPVNPKLSSPFINFINIDLAGDIWLGNERGVDRFFPNEQNINVSSFGYDQGFLGGETNRNSALTDRYGNLWLGTVNGLISAGTDIAGAVKDPPNLFFSEIKVQNQSVLPLPKTMALQNNIHEYSWDVKQINLEFQSVQLNYPNAIQYHWKLEGLEEEWSPLSSNQQVNYSNLEAGTYNFSTAATIDGINFSEAIHFRFNIAEPIWEKLWFKLLLLIGGLFLIGTLIYSRIQQIRKREKEKRQNLEIKNELLNLNQKALQLQMNPHFIFNTLNSINALVAKNENLEARKQINNFAKQLRSTLSNSRKDLISLETEITSLQEYLNMLQFCHAEQFDYSIHADPSIQIEELELPPMIIQPFVENAVLHGFNGLNHKGNLTIHFKLHGQLLECNIEDNGIGRQAATKSKAKKPGAHQSAGMEVTKARLDNLKGKLKYQSLEIIDKEVDGEALGTKVIVRIPYTLSY